MEASSPSLLLLLLLLIPSRSRALLSPNGFSYEVQVLMNVKTLLEDPHGVLQSWDNDSMDPCSWSTITCSTDRLVTGLAAPSQSLSGMLSPIIGNLTSLQTVLLQNNNITGPIPAEIGKLSRLSTLDLSSNRLYGGIPTTMGHLESLQYLRLNNNTLSGSIPSSVAHLESLQFLDLSYNNLSGPVPRLFSGRLNITGNPLICAANTGQDCSSASSVPMSSNLKISQASLPITKTRSHKFAVVGSTIACVTFLSFAM